MNKAFMFFTFILLSCMSCAQGFGTYISENAIAIAEEKVLDSSLYSYFIDHQLIMLGEMHGTQEPAKLVGKLAQLILKNENHVIVGLEIPVIEMDSFMQSKTEASILLSTFFTKENTDGRNGQAWFELIKNCNANPNITLLFFDNAEAMETWNRDSAMYLTVKKQMCEMPNTKIITLSGNVHNALIPYKNKPTYGSYCLADTSLFKPNSICSISHRYSEGTLLNNMGSGIELRTIAFEEDLFSQSSSFENYLIFYNTAEPSANNCIYYTRKVNHSEFIK